MAYLELWRQDREDEGGGEARCRELLDELVQGAPLADSAGALLDLYHLGLPGAPTPRQLREASRAGRHRASAYDALDRVLSGPRAEAWLSWMAHDVLLGRERHSESRRQVALGLLIDHRSEAGKLAILTIARDVEDPLRPAALSSMPAWRDEAVDLFLVGLVGRTFDKRGGAPHPFNLLLERIRDSSAPLGLRATQKLNKRIAYMLISPDWRIASRGIELARGIDPTEGIPLLLDALQVWNRRFEFGGEGSKRVQHEVVRELQRISGMEIGAYARRWRTWWIAVRQGRAPLRRASAAAEGRTSASFFGIQPSSDRVTFVIDCSGSMGTEWGTSGHSRYQEAIDQMMQYLQASGEDTRFNVILFNDSTERSSAHLVAATTKTLEKARNELLEFVPDLGTKLRPAVELALRMGPGGTFDPKLVTADTVVVLCDGETAEGPRWVRPLLERIHAEARVVFHCVMIGQRGDGTLELLAERSGGDFVRVPG